MTVEEFIQWACAVLPKEEVIAMYRLAVLRVRWEAYVKARQSETNSSW